MRDDPTDVPPWSAPALNRRVVLDRRPAGIPVVEDFRIEQAPVPALPEGRFLVRNIYLSVDPAQRGWASSEANYSEPVPLGSPMRALAVGVVVQSRHRSVREGEFLYGWFGWQDYAVADPDMIVMRARLPLPLSSFAGLVGINGLTAHLALTDLGRPRQDETLLVTTAAGAVGSIAGQIGRILGCRTIGVTGGDAKVELCLQRFGYDHAVNYRTADLPRAVAELAPDGVDILFDNTGGDMLDMLVRRMATRGRVIQCGTASVASWTPPPTGLRNEREVLTRRLTWSGFVIFDHRDRFEQSASVLADWYLSGRINVEVDITSGIEHAPGALAEIYAGKNLGKKLIYIGEAA